MGLISLILSENKNGGSDKIEPAAENALTTTVTAAPPAWRPTDVPIPAFADGIPCRAAMSQAARATCATEADPKTH